MNETTQPGFVKRVCADWPPQQWADHSVVAGVSGGADSVALLLALAIVKKEFGGEGELIVAHVNHQLRGEESNKDARFVEDLASKLELPVESMIAEVPEASAAGKSIEGNLRTSRYKLLLGAAQKRGARYLCTAHHANDQAETVLFRILRGTGIDGLAGIPRTRTVDGGVTICRPLLSIDRDTIYRWLTSQGQPWCDDSSNAEPRYARNRIRNEVMPVLKSVVGSDPVSTLCELAESAEEMKRAMDSLADDLVPRCIRECSEAIVIDCSSAQNENSYLLGQAIRRVWTKKGWPTQEMNRVRWNRIFDAVALETTSCQSEVFELPGGIRVIANGETVTMTYTGIQ